MADWNLYDHFDKVLVYEGQYFREYKQGKNDFQGPQSGRFMWMVFPNDDGTLRPYAKGMEVQGELRPGQMLLAGESIMAPTVVEFLVIGGTRMDLEYGLCDRAKEKGNHGTLLSIEMLVGDKTKKETLTIAENKWAATSVELPKADQVVVRLVARRRGGASTNWTGLIVKGDGSLGAREQLLERSPNRDKIGKIEVALKPSPYRVTARPGYDILFYRDKPFLSYAAKGHPGGSHELQAKVGVNTYYVEGMTFGKYWPDGADGVAMPDDSPIHQDLRLCQQFDMPYKVPASLAHCSPFLPPWLVTKENLGLQGHQLRRGGATHTSFIKAKTMMYHKKGLEGWLKPFLDQPTIVVFSQEDDASLWDDYSDEAVASWRAWLTKRFGGDFKAFSDYVGSVKGMEGFETVPQPDRFKPDERFGYPMRLAYLKLLWITESYGDYLAEMFEFTRKIAPGVPLTQRYVNWPNGLYVSERVKADYNYTFGHLTTEGIPNSYGIGKKCWTGIYAHCGTLPLPRGGSIGKTYSREIRRGAMNEKEWRVNAYTAIANGVTGFEYSPFTATWGPEWEQAALYDLNLNLTPTGKAGIAVIKEVLDHSKYMMHYEHHDDVAVFHDASFNTGPFAGPWGQSKVGIYTLIRETGFHADPLTEGDMTAENLKGRKALVLAGSLSIAPEIQDAIRGYVKEGGTLITVFCADGAGFPGCNSYAYACPPRESAKERSFENPKAVAHLGDVLGIAEGAGIATRTEVQSAERGKISLDAFNALVKEGRWVDKAACCAKFAPAASAKVIAKFDDGSPAVIENLFGKGRAVTFAFDLGLIANNLTVPALYQWWSDLLASLGCRKAIDTGNWFVEGGMWRDDSGNHLAILINHDEEHPQKAKLPDGKTVEMEAGGGKLIVIQ
ncbi:MAG: hypothetical protein AB1696_06725 [Planctomycetota bacterium]